LNILQYSIVGPVLSTILFVIASDRYGPPRRPTAACPTASSILPGLLAQAIVNVGFFNGRRPVRSPPDRYIHDVFASPLRWWEINAALVTVASRVD